MLPYKHENLRFSATSVGACLRTRIRPSLRCNPCRGMPPYTYETSVSVIPQSEHASVHTWKPPFRCYPCWTMPPYTHENLQFGVTPVGACLRTRMRPPFRYYPDRGMPPYTQETSDEVLLYTHETRDKVLPLLEHASVHA